MNITLNGQPKTLENIGSVAELLRLLGYEGKRIAVECNGEIVPKSRHGQHTLSEGDEIEIVVAVGGG